MSTDETRPEGAPSEQGAPADQGSAGPSPAADQTPGHVPGQTPGHAPGQTQGQTPGQGQGPAAAPPGQQPYPETGFFASIRRALFPRSDQRWVGGVAGGIADRIGWDPLLVRGILIVSFFLGGLGLILYGVGWALLPERDGRIHLQEAVRGTFDVAMLGAVAVVLTGFAWGGPLGWWDGGGWEWIGFFFWVAVLGVVLYLIVQGIQRQRDKNAARRQGLVPGGPTPGAPTPGVPTPGVPGTPGAPAGQNPTGGVPTQHGAAAPPFTPAPPVEYRGPDGLVYATGAGPAPRQQYAQNQPVSGHHTGGQPVGGQPQPRPVYAPPPVARRTSRGPGAAAVGISVGLILLAGAVILVADRVSLLDGLNSTAELFGAWLGLSTIVLGVAILVSGLRGRTSGLLGFFAIMALLAGLLYMALFSRGFGWADQATVSSRQIEQLVTEPSNEDAWAITEGTAVVETVREARDGFYVQWGEPTIDLSDLDLSRIDAGDPVLVPIELGAGQTRVIVPKDVAVEADADIAAGVVRWKVDDQDRSTSGVGSSEYFASDEVGDEGAVLSLQITAGAGEVVVSETNGRGTP